MFLTTGKNKWDRFQTSIFSIMTQEALAAGAVNLAQGFPDVDGPDTIKDAAIAAIRQGFNQYAPASGLPELRQLLSQRQKRKYDLSYDPATEVTVFSGATEAIYCAFQAFFEPGDEIIAFAPYYDSYPAAAHAAGAKIVGVPLQTPDFTLNLAALEDALTSKTKAIILNTPHNPTGSVFSLEELQAIADIVKQRNLLVITDEVYEELTFDDVKHIPFATLPGMYERTIIISSTSKTFSMTGWKIGYAFAPAAISHYLRTVHQFTVFCSATPLQAGMIAALKLADSYYDELRASYNKQRTYLVEILRKAGFKCRLPVGTYFVLADYSAISDQHDVAFAKWLTNQVKVACIPISGFYDRPQEVAQHLRYVRFGFCKSLATLEQAHQHFQKLGTVDRNF